MQEFAIWAAVDAFALPIVATAEFIEREPKVADMTGKLHFQANALSAVRARKDDSDAKVAMHFLQSNKNEWSGWQNDDARKRLPKC